MRSDREIKQVVIALLTMMTGLTPSEIESDETFLPMLKSAVGEGLANYQFTLSETVRANSPADIEAVAGKAARQAAEQVGFQITTALGCALSLFCSLAQEFKLACPDFDVQDFLHQRGLELAKEG